MKKTILIAIDSLGCGGAERSLLSILNMLNSNEYNIDLLLLKRGGVFEAELPNYINIISPQGFLIDYSFSSIIKRKSLIELIAKCKLSLSLRINKGKIHPAETLWRNIKKVVPLIDKQYDVAIAYSQGLPTYLVADKVNASKKIAWINVDITNAGYSTEYNSMYYNQYNQLVSVSDALTVLLSDEYHWHNQNIRTIYDILNPKLIFKLASKSGFNDNFEGVRLMTIGRLVTQKGYDIAVKAAEIIKCKGYNFRWYVVGEGPERENIESMIAQCQLRDQFILLGLKSNPYSYLKDCDIYVQTSKFEGFGLTVSEAKMFNKPIVSTNFPAVFNQISDRYNGLIAQMTGEDVADKIIELIDSKNLRNSIVLATKSEQNETAKTEFAKVISVIEGI